MKVNPVSEADVSLHFEITPEVLREYANLLELSSQRAMPGETITARFARHGTFSYTMPDVTADQPARIKTMKELNPQSNPFSPQKLA